MDTNVAKNNVNKNITFQTFDMMHSAQKVGVVAFVGHIAAHAFYSHFIYGPYAPILAFPFLSHSHEQKCGAFGYLNIYDEGLRQFTP